MTKQTVSEKALRKLLVDVQVFDSMTNAQKAAFRARVTRYLGIVGDEGNELYDPAYAQIIQQIQDKVGAAAASQSKSMSVVDLVEEFEEGLDYRDARKLGAFKAKARRLMNRSEPEDVERIEAILAKIDEEVTAVNREGILNLAKKAGIIVEVSKDKE